MIAAILFDLDGVLADTARGHFEAWQLLARELGIPFDAAANERLKGVDRMGSLLLLLEGSGLRFSSAELEALAARKNEFYRAIIGDAGPHDLLPGAVDLLAGVRAAGLRTALASASRNAPALIRQLGIAPLLDAIADANVVTKSKPDPEIFLLAARLLDVPPEACVGVEDSAAGIEAIKAAGMRAVGIGQAANLPKADIVVPSTAHVTLETLLGAPF